MVNGSASLGVDPADGDPLRALALGYAPAVARNAVTALFALDAILAAIVRRGRDPIVAQLRLAWWDEALRALDHEPPPAQPVLERLARDVLPAGVRGERLAGMVDGWEILLGDASDDAALLRYAAARGTVLFEAAAQVSGGDPRDPLAAAGAGWALADLPSVAPVLAERGRALAMPLLRSAAARRWDRRNRALGALALASARPPSARRVLRLLVHRLTGR